MAGVYLHIPFCKQACHYCDFHFSTNSTRQGEMVTALQKELILQSSYLSNEEVATVYFGGGTPSLLPSSAIATLLETIRKQFSVSASPEITLEANPEDLTLMKLKELKEAGINRLSIGIQSFDNDVLKFLNRNHTGEEAIHAIEEARSVGFDNISVDLIYAIPGQSTSSWVAQLQKAIALAPEHLSAYSLTIETNTAFGNWHKKGELKLVTDEIAAFEMEVLISELEKAGYDHYEISNFCLPGFYSRHNSSYWDQQKYLGVGPSAHSYNGTARQFNIKNNHLYIKAIETGNVPCEVEELSRNDLINEYLLTTLRTSRGCNLAYLKERFSYDIQQLPAGYLDTLQQQGLMIFNNSFMTLTRKGKLVADKISSDLFAVV